MIRAQFVNLKKFEQQFDVDKQRMTSAFAAALYLLGGQVITAAMRLAPVATGYMRKSRFVQKPEVTPASREFTFFIGFGALYAYWVENRPARHRVGQAGFLAAALAQYERTARTQLQRQTMRFFRAHVGIGSVSVQHPTNPMIGPQPTQLLNARRRAQQRIRVRRQLRHTKQHAGERQE